MLCSLYTEGSVAKAKSLEGLFTQHALLGLNRRVTSAQGTIGYTHSAHDPYAERSAHAMNGSQHPRDEQLAALTTFARKSRLVKHLAA